MYICIESRKYEAMEIRSFIKTEFQRISLSVRHCYLN